MKRANTDYIFTLKDKSNGEVIMEVIADLKHAKKLEKMYAKYNLYTSTIGLWE